ncbi:MAG: hypothetical protein H6711_02765 [Myxococcales bacterium]|nr:hypothetical protein [Myxococcales bacterium]
MIADDGFPHALPHGPIEEVFPDVFVVRGTFRMAPLVTIARNMTILREGEDLTVVTSVRLSAEGEAALERLGTVRHLVRLNGHHGIDDPYYAAKYKPTFWTLPNLKHPSGLASDRHLGADGLPVSNARLFVFERPTVPESALILDRPEGGILCAVDSVQNWTEADLAVCSFVGRIATRLMGFMGPAKIGPGWRRLCEPKDGVGFRPDFERLLQEDFVHLLSAHGSPLRGSAKDDLRATVRRLYGVG